MSDGDENESSEILAKLRAGDERMREARAALRSTQAVEAKREAPKPLDVARVLELVPRLSEEELALREQRRLQGEREAKAQAARWEREAKLERIINVPVRRDLLDAIIDGNLRATPALNAARAWADEYPRKPTLVLLGGVGSGKTTAAAWLMVTHRDAKYIKMRDVANLFRAGFGDDKAAFDALLTVGFLVVDELTTERDVDLGRAALHEVIDERQAKNRPTLLCANRTGQEIAERYDARTMDRLREGAKVVRLREADGSAVKSMREGKW